ncbi:MAG TPA: family 1 encapsulin nanocompartment shell protein [Pseudonocardiaceae bacterium]|jgi:uncharacterized linocin/CFP29 family protein|nr:family 1 encapsulin nanocompartment shell protein [Pseudonocardiaceae bacterium]
MNNLHRELAPVSTAAWSEIEEEARRTFARYAAARRVVDVITAGDGALSGVGTGHLRDVASPGTDVQARLRTAQSLVELRVPFTLSRDEIDNVERGAKDSDWQPVKDAARTIAFAEDRAVFDGFGDAGITGIRPSSSNTSLVLPELARDYPAVVATALNAIREAGVEGPYTVVLSADAYTAATEAADHGYPVISHLERIVDGEIVWAPAIEGAVVLSCRGGDNELHFGQDLSIGYLSHTATTVELYFQESLTFLAYTTEASVAVTV